MRHRNLRSLDKHITMSQLLMLPAELRNAIYCHVLIQPIGTGHEDIASLSKQRASLPRRDYKRCLCAAILRTCRQVNEEASPILYGQNLFAAHPSLLATLPSLITNLYPRHCQFPPVLCEQRIAMIRRFRVEVRLDVDPRFDSAAVKKSFDGVEELQVIVYQAMYGGSDFSVLALFEDVRGVKRARVGGSVGNGKYANWLEASMMSSEGSAVAGYTETEEASTLQTISPAWVDR